MGGNACGGRERRDVVAVGLTGGIGAGKSTALALFGERGAVTVSADRLVHAFYEQPAASSLIGSHFGVEVLDDRGLVDRSRLAEAVLGRPEELHWLEELVHPWVAEEILRIIKAAPAGSVVVCEVPLLFEAGLDHSFDLVVTVEASSETRRRRSSHAFDLEQFSELESLQASSERRVEESDLVFFNDGGLDCLARFVADAYERAHALLEEDE